MPFLQLYVTHNGRYDFAVKLSFEILSVFVAKSKRYHFINMATRRPVVDRNCDWLAAQIISVTDFIKFTIGTVD